VSFNEDIGGLEANKDRRIGFLLCRTSFAACSDVFMVTVGMWIGVWDEQVRDDTVQLFD
jgi:hypothetical protein